MAESAASFTAYYGSILRDLWRSSKWFRIFLIITLIWATLRLVTQLVLTLSGGIGDQIGVDLQVHLTAAENFVHHIDLYPKTLENLEGHFPYPPTYAFLISPVVWLPQQVIVIVHFLSHFVFYYLLFFQWGKIFQRWNLEKASRALILSIPLWLVFSAFWDDVIYLNIYILLALFGTLLIKACLDQDLLQSSIWLTLILITKPQWAFAAIIPLLLGHYRFFFKLVILSLLIYCSLGAIALIVGGPGYVWTQYKDYFNLLARLGRDFPWRGPGTGFLGYNHSIKQIFAYYLGNNPINLLIATIVKIILLVPLAVIAIHRIFHPIHQQEQQIRIVIETALLFYLGAFIWLDIVWEISLGIAIFTYLLAEVTNKPQKIIIVGVFLPYAVQDVWRLVAYIAGAPMINDAYLSWDYSLFIPTTMIVILTFYSVLVARLWPWGSASHRDQLSSGA